MTTRRGWSGGCVGRKALGEAADSATATSAFTIVELLVVMAIVLVLVGLVLATSSYVHNKGARSRAEAEIAAISAALENYKADNGAYPSATATNTLDAKTATPDFTKYGAASAILYQGVTGDTNGDGIADGGAKSYMSLKSNQLGGTGFTTYVQDPFGMSYGYSTAGQFAANSGTTQTVGYNPTFDLWSTSGSVIPAGQVTWVKNW